MNVAGVGIRVWGGLGVARALNVGIAFAISVILMRQLGPGPFGLVAMADGVLAIFGAVGDAGIGASLVSDRERSPARTSAAVLAALALGTLLAGAMLLLTPIVRWYYQRPEIVPIWIALALAGSVALLQSIPFSLAQVGRRFAGIGAAELGATVLAGGVAILSTIWWTNAWPIVLRRLVQVGITPVLLWVVARPVLGLPDRQGFGTVLQFGKGVAGFNLLNAIGRNADNLIIGRYLGGQALGLYGLAYQILVVPKHQASSFVQTIAYPELARHAPDWSRVAGQLSRVVAGFTRFFTPLGIGVSLVAGDLVPILFGTGWTGAIQPLRILALLLIYQAPFGQLGMAFLLSRKTGELTRWGLISTPLIVAGFFMGLPWGLIGVTTSYALVSVGLAPVLVRLAARTLGVRASVLYGPAVRALLYGVRDALPIIMAYGAATLLDLAPGFRLGAAAVAGVVVVVGLAHTRHSSWMPEPRPVPSAEESQP